MAADVEGNLGFQSKDTSMATVSMAVRQSEASLDITETVTGITVVNSKTNKQGGVGGAHRPGKSVRRGSPPTSRSPRPPQNQHQHQQPDVPDLDFVRNLEHDYHSKTHNTNVPHAAFNAFDALAAVSVVAMLLVVQRVWVDGTATPRTQADSSVPYTNSLNFDDNSLAGDTHNMGIDIQDLSGSVQLWAFD